MPRPQYEWETNYGYWRHQETVTLGEWTARTPAPVPQLLSIDALNGMGEEAKAELFHECLIRQAKGLSANVLRYRSPRLEDVTAAVRAMRGAPCLPTCIIPILQRCRARGTRQSSNEYVRLCVVRVRGCLWAVHCRCSGSWICGAPRCPWPSSGAENATWPSCGGTWSGIFGQMGALWTR